MQKITGTRSKLASVHFHKIYEYIIEYLVEFENSMINNISSVALGGQNADEFDWTLEVESFSSFSYTIMR